MNRVLIAHNVGKVYRLYRQPSDRLLAMLGIADRSSLHWALKNISFELHKGQCLGVVGDNGAGKSTLLKLLAGTLTPSQGRLQRQGRLTAILELGAGFHPDFTGRENLKFGASYVGIDSAQLDQLIPEIIEFAELADAIDRPVKTYSSGMVVRLAFALVTAVQPEVLIIDEALAVGDQHFQKKCVQRIQEFRQNGCTVLFCSHSMYHIRQLCDSVLWLDGGEVKGYGDVDTVLARYEAYARRKDAAQSAVHSDMDVREDESHVSARVSSDMEAAPVNGAKLTSASVAGLIHDEKTTAKVLAGPDLRIALSAVTMGDEPPSFGVMLEQHKGVGITSIATHAEGIVPRRIDAKSGVVRWSIELIFSDLPLHSGEYVLSFYLFDSQGLIIFDEWKDYIVFEWVSPSLTPGLVRLPHSWR